jgi:DNA polymerase-3 subunit alpha
MTDDGESQGLRVIADNVFDLATIRKRFAKGIRIACNGNASAERLAEILQPFRPGTTPITVRYANERIGGELELPEVWRVNPDDTLIERLREWLAPENVQVVY